MQATSAAGGFLTGVVDLFGGANHSLASKPDGTIWGWGLNSLGQAGSFSTGTNPTSALDIKNGSRDVLIIWALEDPDGDSLLNWQERALGTDPNNRDTDADGIPDDYEVAHALNPLVNDAAADPDGDLFTNAQEYAAGTDPHNPDTDGDLLRDGDEIYPLDPHFALKRTSEINYAVVEIVSDPYVGKAKLNNLGSVIYSKTSGGYPSTTRSWLWKNGPASVPVYLYALDEPNPPPVPVPPGKPYNMAAVDINDQDQIAGYSSYDYPPDFTGFHDVQMTERLHHAVIGTGKFRDLGDGCVDNGINDATGVPTIDGTNKGQSQALAINNSGMIAGYADFFVDVDPPSGPGYNSIVRTGDSLIATFGAAPPASKLPPAAIGLAVSAMNDLGSIVGYANAAGGGSTARLWKGGVLLDLALIPGYPYGGSTYAFALNEEHYVGGAQYSFYNSADHRVPFLWHENILTGGDGKMIQLAVPFNTRQAEVLGMNKDGVMVGYANDNNEVKTGVLWQNAKNFSMTSRLNTAAISAGWSVQKLWDINDNGAIVASAYRTGFQGLVLLVPDPAVQLITPSGDPINAPVDTAVDGQNEFTFDASNLGVLNVHLKAKVLAAGTAAALAPRCRFTVDGIGSSTMAWGANNAGGQPTANGDYLEADLTFTGLPTNNSDFGRKKVTITVDGAVKDQKAMEVFYLAKEYNHSGGSTPDPNWFYYYKQNAGGGSYTYDPTPGVRSHSLSGGGEISIQFGDYVHSPGDSFFTTSIVGGLLTVTGISTVNQYYPHFLGVLAHERQHANNEVNSGPPIDTDFDRLSDTFEITTSKTDPNYSRSASSSFGGQWDDGEVYAGGPVEEAGIGGADASGDWANPGSNSKQ